MPNFITTFFNPVIEVAQSNPQLLPFLIASTLFVLCITLVKSKVLVLNKKDLWEQRAIKLYVLPSLFLLIIIIGLYLWPKEKTERPTDLRAVSEKPEVQGTDTGQYETQSSSEKTIKLNCNEWTYCTDFKDDLDLVNKYYIRAKDDPQKLILEGGPFRNPSIYINHPIIPPSYRFTLIVQPYNGEGGNIFIESENLYQLFIGDNDYSSLAFILWNNYNDEWERRDNSKIYFGKDLKLPDMEPKTQFSIDVQSDTTNTGVKLTFSLKYRSNKETNETAIFNRNINIPAANPKNFSTKLGAGMYRAPLTIPQAKFTFMGIKIN